MIALLLLYLTNLRLLQDEIEGLFCEHIREVLDHLGSIKSCTPLSHLRTVEVNLLRETESCCWVEYDSLKSYLEIPSVKKLSARMIETEGHELSCQYSPPPCSSNIKILVLIECAIDSKLLHTMLLSMDSLEYFLYTPCRIPPGSTDEVAFEPYWIRTALMSDQKWSFKGLTLRVGESGCPKTFMGSLNLFDCLETLNTDLVLLLGDLSDTFMDLQLALPKSIKHVTLHVENPNDGFVDWKFLENLKEHQKFLPHLVRLTMEGNFPTTEEERRTQTMLIAQFEAMGILLSFVPSTKIDHTFTWECMEDV